MNAQCAWRIYEGYGERSCRHKPIISEDGRWWCAQHAPSKVKARQAAKDDLWEKEHIARHDKDRLQAAAPDLLAALEAVVAEAAYHEGRLHDVGQNEPTSVLVPVAQLIHARAAIAKAKGEQP